MRGLLAGCIQNDLVCIPQDLQTLFVYWTFTPQRIETLKDFLSKVQPDSHLILRLCCPASSSLEREIILPSIGSGSYYFQHINPRFTYHAELGVRTPEGQFILFSRTPEIKLQPSEAEMEDRPLQLAGEKTRPEDPGSLFSSWS